MWRPSIDRHDLAFRAQLLANIREFFRRKEIMEVEVPVLGASTVTDPFLSPIGAYLDDGAKLFLQTSPEYFMKRLLAGGCGSIYYLGKAFRRNEIGKHHNIEFTMLEWYRKGFNDEQLMQEIIELIQWLVPETDADLVSYATLFETHVGLNPHYSSVTDLADKAKSCLAVAWEDEPKSLWLDLLFSHFVEPNLQDLTVVYDYPSCQCALARLEVNDQGVEVAKRFEVFWRGKELANGFWELTDAEMQRGRFLGDLVVRKQMGLPEPQLDENFLAALETGLPECAGVAMGVDRLMMCLLNKDNIGEVLAFPFERL